MKIAANAPGNLLAGQTLADGWKVDAKVTRPPGSTGGNFSVGYWVSRPDGRRGFLKAIDISAELASSDPATALNEMTEIFLFEKDLLELCVDCPRVITAIASGTVQANTIPGAITNSPVFYLIFELANGDARGQVNLASRLSIAHVFTALQQVATGLQQLHARLVAHQDIKPSNILYIGRTSSGEMPNTKIGDLGRASLEDKVPRRHASLKFAGTKAYTPPELLYGAAPSDWRERRICCDLYSLGSMIVFFFCGQPTNAFIAANLQPQAHHWNVWRGFYRDVEASLQASFATSLQQIRAQVIAYIDPKGTKSIQRERAIEEVMRSIEQLCNPQLAMRGHPLASGKNRFDLQRYISLFNFLAERARLHLI